jgi:hypothetical protein
VPVYVRYARGLRCEVQRILELECGGEVAALGAPLVREEFWCFGVDFSFDLRVVCRRSAWTHSVRFAATEDAGMFRRIPSVFLFVLYGQKYRGCAAKPLSCL